LSREQGATRLRVTTEADVSRCIAEAKRACGESGLGDVDAQAVCTAVSELVRNILKYAGVGELLLQPVESGQSRGIMVTARDRGPGIRDIEAAMRDHYSSSGTLGLGLPGVRRMMDDFTIESEPGKRTEVSALKWADPPPRERRTLANSRSEGCRQHGNADEAHLDLDAAAFSRPCAGERFNGDLALIDRRDHLLMLAVIDGLGHGPDAHRVAAAAGEFLRCHWSQDVGDTMERLHGELRGGLGAVAGIAVADSRNGEIRFAGTGNIAYRVVGSRSMRLPSMAGHLGQQIRAPQVQQHILSPGDVAIMYSDGVKDRFEPEEYPQIRYQSAQRIARTLVERFGKPHDDATCIALRLHT
jgi:anti-sigma regulatory factor (Ser/Thr protein kinase)